MDALANVTRSARANRIPRKVWIIAATAILGAAAIIAVAHSILAHPGATGIGGQPAWFRVLFGLVWGPVVLASGLLLLWHAPRSMAGQFVCVMSIALITSQYTFDLGSAWLSGLATELFLVFGGGIVIPSLGYFMATFPDGKVFPPQLRPFLMATVVIKFIGAALEIMASSGHIKVFVLPTSPMFVPALAPFQPLIAATIGLTGVLLPAGLAIGLGLLLFRYRSAGTQTRQQIKWVVWALGVLVVAVLLAMMLILGWAGRLTENNYVFGALFVVLAQFGFISALMIAIFRYHLFNIDILINRSMVYGALTASILALYVLLVGTLSELFKTSGNLLISLFVTGVVAVLFQPLREHLQRGVNRILYGERDEPYTVLSRLGRRLGATFVPDEALMTVVETVTQALKLPYAALYVGNGDSRRLRAEYGRRTIADANIVAFSLTYQSEWVGNLEVAQRSRAEPFTPTERRLIEDIAHQAGVAAYAARLTTDLQRSREHLVTSREEERRRLRRDLHDGLGTTLTGVRLKIGQALSQMPADSPYAPLLVDAKAQTQQAITDIRRLVYDLRPPILDELGLIAAIREHVARFGFDFHATEGLPALSAAVELAAYRIATEAMNNVVRHAKASRCDVCIRFGDGGQGSDNATGAGATVGRQPTLIVEIIDDGVGLPLHAREGVGITAMRERASELGGTLGIERIPDGGTRVVVKLPLG